MRDERQLGATERERDALAFVRERLADPGAELEILSGDASFRRYFRVQRSRMESGAPLLLMDAPPETEPVEPFVQVQAILADAQIRVPDVAVIDDGNGFILLEDLGDELLYRRLAARIGERDGIVHACASNCEGLLALYRTAIDSLVDMQARVSTSMLPVYDATLLRRELMLFPDWYIGCHLGRDAHTYDRGVVEAVFDALIDEAIAQPACFVHRDYHSRNLLVIVDHGVGRDAAGVGGEDDPIALAMIDFQDAVRGPVTYDLASLLRDVYVELQDELVGELVGYYRVQAARLLSRDVVAGVSDAQFLRWFDWISIQRHLKIMGIFARLKYRDGKAGYMTSIPLTVRYLRREAARYAEMEPLLDLLDSLHDG
jgi:aminoglycoside/choline kinase family phosphotransferase